MDGMWMVARLSQVAVGFMLKHFQMPRVQAHGAALQHMIKAGGTLMTWLAATAELQRD
jgi:hypothetical protein